MSRLRAVLPLILLIAIGVALWATGTLDRFRPHELIAQQQQLHEAVSTHPLLAVCLYIAAVALVIGTGVPASWVVILAGGMLFGILYATFLTATGELLGSLMLFFAARHAFRAGTRPPPHMAERVRRGYLLHPVGYTLFLRLVPVLPFGGVTVALAWLRCPLWLFAIATFVGGCVMAVFETAIGAGLAQSLARDKTIGPDLLLQPRVLIPIIALALLALVPLVVQRLRSRRASRREPQSDDQAQSR
ncbi:MAG TPA: VTT domain-containing protein [Rhodanobacteraceae bacterium]|nr:VTT domain-containing protein [Rhodanobacteraceae bacterium]